jgi:hypothetical protein
MRQRRCWGWAHEILAEERIIETDRYGKGLGLFGPTMEAQIRFQSYARAAAIPEFGQCETDSITGSASLRYRPLKYHPMI